MANIQKIGIELARGILDYFGIIYVPTKQKYYRVQVGAFTVEASAKELLKKLKAAGSADAFIKFGE